jgi:lactate dehydrogenase-like 2-hydroxyacid dehydrogenase
VLYPEARQQPDNLETEVFGPDLRIVKRDAGALSELSDADCAEADGLMIMGFAVTGADLARFPRLRAIVRMGVGYDKLDRPAAAERNITPHSAWLTPHSFEDTRRKSAETMRAALLTNRPQNVITPEMF